MERRPRRGNDRELHVLDRTLRIRSQWFQNLLFGTIAATGLLPHARSIPIGLRGAADKRRLDALLTEHSFWMADAGSLRPGEASRRAVCMPDGSILNRYWDETERPRDESYAEDVTHRAAQRPASAQLCFVTFARPPRAAGTSRPVGRSVMVMTVTASGRSRLDTHLSIVPIDLNCLLFGLEQSIARRATGLGVRDIALRLRASRGRRRQALQTYCWSEREQRFGDCLWSTGRHDLLDQCGRTIPAVHRNRVRSSGARHGGPGQARAAGARRDLARPPFDPASNGTCPTAGLRCNGLPPWD